MATSLANSTRFITDDCDTLVIHFAFRFGRHSREQTPSEFYWRYSRSKLEELWSKDHRESAEIRTTLLLSTEYRSWTDTIHPNRILRRTDWPRELSLSDSVNCSRSTVSCNQERSNDENDLRHHLWSTVHASVYPFAGANPRSGSFCAGEGLPWRSTRRCRAATELFTAPRVYRYLGVFGVGTRLNWADPSSTALVVHISRDDDYFRDSGEEAEVHNSKSLEVYWEGTQSLISTRKGSKDPEVDLEASRSFKSPVEDSKVFRNPVRRGWQSLKVHLEGTQSPPNPRKRDPKSPKVHLEVPKPFKIHVEDPKSFETHLEVPKSPETHAKLWVYVDGGTTGLGVYRTAEQARKWGPFADSVRR